MAENKSLVSQEDLNNLAQLESQLEKVNGQLDENLEKLNKLSSELGKASASYEKITKAAEELAKTEEEVNENIEDQKKVVEEINEVKEKVIKTETEVNKKLQEEKKLIDLSNESRDRATKSIDEESKQLVRLQNYLKQVRDQMKNLDTAYKTGKKSADSYLKEKARLASIESDLSVRVREQGNLVKANAQIVNTAVGSYANLSAQYSALKIVVNRMDDAEKVNGKTKAELVKQLSQLYKAMNEYQKSTGKATLQVGNYPEAIKGAIGANNQFANSLLSLVDAEGGLKGFFANVTTNVKSFGKALLGLMANPAFLVIAGIAGAVAAVKFWYDYNKGLEEATRLTQQFTGLSGNELKAYRNEVQAVADTFNKEFVDVLKAANAVAKQFRIDQTLALKYITDGFVAGADANGEFLKNLKEYPAYFNEAGISASEFVAIIAQTSKDGIFSDKGIDAIKEANIRLREMTNSTASALEGIGISSKQVQKDLRTGLRTTFDVMKQVSEQLSKLPKDSKEVGKAIADIFGSPGEDAGLQYIIRLKDIQTNLEDVKNAAGELGRLQEQQLRSQADLNNALAALFDKTGGSFEGLTTSIKVFVNDGLNYLITKVIEVINYFVNLYNEMTVIRAAIAGWTAAIYTGWNVTKTILSAIIDNFIIIGNMIKGLFTGDFDLLFKSADNYIRLLGKTVDNLVDDVVKSYNEGLKNFNLELTPIEIPIKMDENIASAQESIQKTVELIQKTIPKKGVIKILSPEELKELERQRKEAERIRSRELQDNAKIIQIQATQEAAANRELMMNQKKNYQERITASIDYHNRIKQGIEDARDEQLKDQTLTDSQRKLIIDKANADIQTATKSHYDTLVKIDADYQKDQQKQLDRYQSQELSNLRQQQLEEEQELAISLQNGEVKNKEEYEQKKLDIQNRYAAERYNVELETLRQIAELYIEDEDKYQEIQDRILKLQADNQARITQQTTSEIKKRTDKEIEEGKRLQAALMNLYKEINNTVFSLIDSALEKQIQGIEKQLENLTEYYEEKNALITQQEEDGLITAEYADFMREYYAEQEQHRQEELEEQKKEIQRKQAKYEKAQAILSATIATGVAVAQALPNIPLSIVVGVLGAAQVAAIAAQPLPQYAQGTADHKGGAAIVGDGGKSEMIVTPDGSIYKTPALPTMVDLPKHSEVFPDFNREIKNMHSADMKSIIVVDDGKQVALLSRNLSASRDSQKYLQGIYSEQRKNNRILLRNNSFGSSNLIKKN